MPKNLKLSFIFKPQNPWALEFSAATLGIQTFRKIYDINFREFKDKNIKILLSFVKKTLLGL